MKTPTVAIMTALLTLAMCSDAAEIKVVTEYRYPTSYRVTPITTQTANGSTVITGGIVEPSDFVTREVGVRLVVEAEAGRMGGLASVVRGGTLINGNTPLMVAATSGDARAVRRHLAAGDEVNTRNLFGSTALLGAAAGGYDDIVRELLRAGADPTTASESGATPLMFAARNGHTDVVRILLAAGADVAAIDDDGQTALELAQEHERKAIIVALTRANAAR